MSGNDYPLVSVIIPYYNGRQFIREAIQSLLDQTYKNIEFIVVDDASSDRVDSEYIENLSKELGFKLIKHEKNKGIGHALADAVDASNGDYIAELSQDDLYKPEKIKKQLNELMSKNLDAVFAVGDILYQETGKIEKRDIAKIKHVFESGTAAKCLKFQNLSCISIQGLLAKRSVFEKDIVPLWRDFLLDDWPVSIRLFERYRVGFLSESLWIGRGHRQNTSRNIWKWLGPQIEVIARMAPEHLKAEGIGSRLVSMARRLHKQNGDQNAVIRFAFAGLMLTESPEQYKKAARVLAKTPSKNRKALTTSKQKLLEAVIESPQEKSSPERTGVTNWENLGKDIANVVGAYEGRERLHNIGKVFFSLANSILLETQLLENVFKIALAALILMDNLQDEKQIVDLLRCITIQYKGRLIREKLRLLKVNSRLTLKSLFPKVSTNLG